MAQQPQNRPLRLGHGPTQLSAVNPQQAARMRTNGVYYYDDTLAEIGTFVANNTGFITLPTGRYTYRLWNFSIAASAAIAGVTTLRDGKNIVDSAKIADYVDMITIEINGQARWELTAAELLAINGYWNLDTSNGVLRVPFGSPNIHNVDMVEDAYQLGTGNLTSLKIRIRTKAAWVTGMQPILAVEYAPVSRPIGYMVTTTRYSYTNPGAGNFSITDLAVGKDFSTIWVAGNNINSAKLFIDREDVFNASTYNVRALHEAWGKDVAALGNGLMIDTFRDGDGVGVDSVANSRPERARGADVRLDLTMGAAGQALNVVIFHCGLFWQQ